MSKIELSMSVCDYDRTRAIFDGRARIDGCEVVATPLEPEESFHRAFKYQEFDVSELSLSSFTMMTSRGAADYVGIPAFVSRLFRHSGLYIRTDRGIKTPADLKGKTIGLPEYQITANVWIRGVLEDQYGVKPADVKWRQGGVEEPGRTERAPLKLPPEIDIKAIPTDRSLSDMLEKGEIDGLMGARAPSCFTRGAPNVDRMWPDYRAVEKEYFAKTKIFPIMHIIGIRKSLAEKHPWLAVNVYKAFLEAKKLCMHEMGQIGHLFTSLPWGVAEFDATRAAMGDDFWSYGAHANQHVLDTFLDYHHKQGLSQRRVKVEELFAPSTFELSKV